MIAGFSSSRRSSCTGDSGQGRLELLIPARRMTSPAAGRLSCWP